MANMPEWLLPKYHDLTPNPLSLLLVLNFFRILILAVPISVYLAMIVIGVQYNVPAKCRLNHVTEYLIIGGSFRLALTLMSLATRLKPLRPAASLSSFLEVSILIYGTYVIRTKYDLWDHKDSSSPHFCAFVPFMLAFVCIIVDWVLLLLACGYMCMYICLLQVAHWTRQDSANSSV